MSAEDHRFLAALKAFLKKFFHETGERYNAVIGLGLGAILIHVIVLICHRAGVDGIPIDVLEKLDAVVAVGEGVCIVLLMLHQIVKTAAQLFSATTGIIVFGLAMFCAGAVFGPRIIKILIGVLEYFLQLLRAP